MSERVSFRLQHLTARFYDALQRMYSEVPYRAFKSGKAFPAWHYLFEVTRRCNLRCRMCQYISWLENASGEEQRDGELTTDEWKRVIDQVGRLSFITFTGGEPLMRSDFLELLAYASRKSRTHYISNATMLTEKAAISSVACAPRHLGGRGLNFIGVSLEGPGEIHDAIRQQTGAFERSTAGIRMLNKMRKRAGKSCPLVHITSVIQQANVAQLEYLPEIVASIGADVLNLVTESRMHDLPGLGERPYGIWKHEDVSWPRIERKALEDAFVKTDEAARKHGVEVRWPRMPREELLRYYESSLNVRDYTCRSPWNTLIIGRTGDA
ncbi:MAG: radical SAM protein, partial [Candidatus Hydrogenedentes bacterium]|nr:radical SAM protein [Candidatus Hydrogenedentota bacterium]